MKKLTSLLLMAFVSVMSLTLTSCDEDANIAYTLDGSWSGYLKNVVNWNGQSYVSNTVDVTFNAGYDSGNGYWLDKYSNAPWDYVANHISWKVRNGMIYIDFLDTHERAIIRNYQLNERYFYGDIEFNSTNQWISFKLVKTSAPNWNRYYWYGTDSWYDTWRYYGYSRKQAGTKATEGDEQIKEENAKEQNDSISSFIRRPNL